MKRCVIIAGAEIVNYEYVRSHIREDDYIIFCDCGLKHMDRLGCRPDLIVGDFDSYVKPDMDAEIIELPQEKDDTDTFYAAKEAMKRGYKEFLFAGVIGNRLDHSLANVSVLLMLDTNGCRAIAVDDYSQMEIISGGKNYIEDSFSYFSLINISGETRDVTITNAKYCIEHADIHCDYQYGVSNEVIPGKTAEVIIGSGRALLIKVL